MDLLWPDDFVAADAFGDELEGRAELLGVLEDLGDALVFAEVEVLAERFV